MSEVEEFANRAWVRCMSATITRLRSMQYSECESKQVMWRYDICCE